jgi:AraC-like DNA-binding protein
MVGSNRRYVSDAITEATDMNFNNYINFYRINEAKKRIIEGEDSISEVQYACGFNSRTTFYTAFKKFTGMPPSEFRKISRKKREKNSKSPA